MEEQALVERLMMHFSSLLGSSGDETTGPYASLIPYRFAWGTDVFHMSDVEHFGGTLY